MISKINLKNMNFYNRKCFLLLRVFLIIQFLKFLKMLIIFDMYNLVINGVTTHEILLCINEVYGNLYKN